MKSCWLFIILLLSTSVFGQTQSSETDKNLTEIQKLNVRVVKLYGEKNFDEALKISLNIFGIVTENRLTGDARVLPALRNLGEIYLVKEKYSDAVSVLQTVADGYEKTGEAGSRELEKTLSRLVVAYTNKNDLKNAEIYLLKQKAVAEKIYGERSRQSASVNFQLANIYNQKTKYTEADAHYLKSVLTYDAVLNEAEKENRKDVETYKCFLYHRAYQKNGLREAKNLFNELKQKRGISREDKTDQGVVNGKALNLVRPNYPDSARLKRATGFAVVSVEIDEQGNVTKAKATCGFLDFVREVEAAALKSKFTVTTVKGIPTKVTGAIVYNFVAR